MLEALEEIYEKMAELKRCSVDSLSNEELAKAKKLLKDIRETNTTMSQAIISQETIRKLYSKD